MSDLQPMPDDFRAFMEERVGKSWVEELSDDELRYFFDWARKCQVFQVYPERNMLYAGSVDDALRGFCKGRQYENPAVVSDR